MRHEKKSTTVPSSKFGVSWVPSLMRSLLYDCFGQMAFTDLRAPQPGIPSIRLKKAEGENIILVGDFFAGGFSGWSYAIKTLVESRTPVKHCFSIEQRPLHPKRMHTIIHNISLSH